MKTIKGQEGLSIETIIALVFGIAVAAIVIAVFFPIITGADEAAGCQGLLRPIASLLANVAGINIC